MADVSSAEIIKRRFFASYALALFFLVAVSLGSHLFIERTLTDEREAARMVNLSGAQRMLSQRALALSQSLSQAEGRTPERLERLAITLNRFQASHTELRTYALTHPMGDALSAQFQAQFTGTQGLDTLVASFVAVAEPAAGGALSEADLASLELMAYGPLFQALDEAVSLYQADAEAGLASVAAAHMIQLIVILLVLVAEALFIFWPLTRRLLTTMAEETRARLQAEDALRLKTSLDASKERFFGLVHAEFLRPSNRVSDHLETMAGGDRAAWPGLRTEASREVDTARQRVGDMLSYFEDWRSPAHPADQSEPTAAARQRKRREDEREFT